MYSGDWSVHLTVLYSKRKKYQLQILDDQQQFKIS